MFKKLTMIVIIAMCLLSSVSAKEKTFILVSKCVHPYFGPVYAGFEAAGKKYGVKTEYIAPVDYVLQEQVKVLENLVSRNVDGFAVAAIDDDGITDIVNTAIDNGIKVVCFDSDAPSSKRLGYIGTNNHEAGRVGAEYLTKVLDFKGELALLQGGLGASNINARYKGFIEYMKKNNPDANIVAREDTDTKFEVATNKAEAILQAYPNIKGIFGFTAECAPGAAIALEDSGKDGKVILGGFDDLEDTLEAIRAGTVNFCLAQMTYKMGWLSLVSLLKATEGEKILDNTDTGMMIITKENVDNYMVEMEEETQKLK